MSLSPGTSRAEVNVPTRTDDIKRVEWARRIWKETCPAVGTLVETYLRGRGITQTVSPVLRFHPALHHNPTDLTFPAMVSLVTRGADNSPTAIHRTYLARDGAGKAPVKPQKMMLGPCSGGAVRLAPLDDVLMVGEGIETCLSAMQAAGYPAWAALSVSGLNSLDLPQRARDVIVLADGDDRGEAAARAAALRWMREGRRVRIARPPRGSDFNNMLLGRMPGLEKDAA